MALSHDTSTAPSPLDNEQPRNHYTWFENINLIQTHPFFYYITDERYETTFPFTTNVSSSLNTSHDVRNTRPPGPFHPSYLSSTAVYSSLGRSKQAANDLIRKGLAGFRLRRVSITGLVQVDQPELRMFVRPESFFASRSWADMVVFYTARGRQGRQLDLDVAKGRKDWFVTGNVDHWRISEVAIRLIGISLAGEDLCDEEL